MKEAMTPSAALTKPLIVKWREWLSVLIMSPFAIFAIFSVQTIEENSLIDLSLDVAGWICFWTGASLRWWATLYIGARKNQVLACEGPYSICRNPLYLGSFLLAFSIAFFLHSLTFAIGLLIASPIYFLITISWEEKQLRAVFGDDFIKYCERVPRLLPSPALFGSPTTITVCLKGLQREFLYSLCWLWIPIAIEVISELRTQT